MLNSRSIVGEKRPNIYLSFYLIAHLLIGALTGLAVLTFIDSNISDGGVVYPLSLFLVGLYFWCLWSWKRETGSLFNPYILFLTSLMLFNAGQSFLELFHLNKYGYLDGAFDYTTLTKTLLLVALSIYTLHFGALLALKKITVTQPRNDKSSEAKALRAVGWILFAFSVVSSVIIMKQAIGIVLANGYFGLYSHRTIVTGFSNIHQVLAAFLIPSAMFLLVGSKEKRSTLYFSWGIILGNTLIQFFLGSRTYAAMPLIAYIWLYDCSIKRIPRSLLVACGTFLMSVVFPLIHVVRDQTGSDKYSIGTLVQNYFSIENPLVTIIREMGGSMNTVAETILVVPFHRAFDLGVGYYYALLTAMPNLFWDVHPSIAHGTYAVWVTWEIDPASAAVGYGAGFSAIAETYVNFGWFGIIVMGLFGYWLTKFFHGPLHRQDLAKLAMVAIFLSYILFFARSESNAMVRSLLWYAFIPYIMFLIMRGHYRKGEIED